MRRSSSTGKTIELESEPELELELVQGLELGLELVQELGLGLELGLESGSRSRMEHTVNTTHSDTRMLARRSTGSRR